MEQLLLASSLRSRQDYELVHSHINMKLATYSKPFQAVMTKIGEYYRRDPDAQLVVVPVLLAQIEETVRNDKHIERFRTLIEEAVSLDYSEINVRATVLLAKQRELGDQLAVALTSAPEKVDKLLEEYTAIQKATSLEELDDEEGLEVYHDVDILDLLQHEQDPSSIIKLYPLAISDRIGGGAKKGHHITIFARPETGKTATCITASAGFARQGKRSMYVINEDRPQDIIVRHISCLTGLDKHEVYRNPQHAKRLAEERGLGNIIVVSAAPGTPKQIEEFVEKYEPDCVVVDQMRNLKVRSDNRVNQLEMAATACRNIAKQCDVLVLSVTQAGDSADGKVFLDMGDVDYSNTGIPAQADVMIGVGMDAAMEAEGRRGISLCKNKLGGEHSQFVVNINQRLSRITSIGE